MAAKLIRKSQASGLVIALAVLCGSAWAAADIAPQDARPLSPPVSPTPRAGAGKDAAIVDFAPALDAHLAAKAQRAYDLITQLRAQIVSVGEDLDGGGKEITRLIRTSDLMSKSITELFGLWPENDLFRDACSSAKRRALSLNEELSRVPRKWTYVRWTYAQVQEEVRKLRVQARDLAEAEPRQIMLKDKKGNVTYVDPPPVPVDPDVARRQEQLKELEVARESERKLKDSRQQGSLLPTDTHLDDDKAVPMPKPLQKILPSGPDSDDH